MTFLNLTFLFLFSLVPISLLSSEPLVRPVRSTQDSRDASPAMEVRVKEGQIPTAKDEYESVMSYDFPRWGEVRIIQVIKENNRRSFPPSNTQVTSSTSHSLPEESKLEKMVASAPANQVLSQSTEKLNSIKTFLETASTASIQMSSSC